MMGIVGNTVGRRDEVGDAPSCVGALAGDLGWGLGVVLRAYAMAAHTAVATFPAVRGATRSYPPRLRALLAASSLSRSTSGSIERS